MVLLFGLLVWLSYFDILERRLPNQLVLAVAGLGLGLALWRSMSLSSLLPLQGSLLGMLLAAGPALLFSLLYYWLRKRDGFGAGDIKLLAALGLFFGPMGIALLPLASLMATLVTLPRLLFSIDKTRWRTIAFGPYLSLAAFILLFTVQVL